MRAADATGIKPLLGAEMTLEDSSHLTVLAADGTGYKNLCRLITCARRDQEKGIARLALRDLATNHEGLIVLSGCRQGRIPRLLAANRWDEALQVANGYARLFGEENFYIEVQRHYQRGEMRLLAQLAGLARQVGLGIVATGNVHYIDPAQQRVQDVLTCIRHLTTLDDAARDELLRTNNEYFLRSPADMHQLFERYPDALINSVRIAERCAHARDLLPTGPQTMPRYPTPEGLSGQDYLRALCLERLHVLYPTDPPLAQLEKELDVIGELELADYFLIVWDIVRFARESKIRHLGRGSAANSLVAYLLGISPVDPMSAELVFERFLSTERGSPPDIDIDFDAGRREKVIQYTYERYGREHAAMVCTVVTYRARSAVRDVARALGFPTELVERLAKVLDVRRAESIQESAGLVNDFGTDLAGRPFRFLLEIVPQLEGMPRHIGLHNGGMILSGPPLENLAPVEPARMDNRSVIQWDKYVLDAIGLIKLDILGLRMLSAIEDAITIVENQTGKRPRLEDLTYDDPEIYEMIQRGETIGVFQVESRAQADLIPRFRPQKFADLIIQISLIRPGPLQAQMVRPYLRRRHGLEPVTYSHPSLEPALRETLGVIIFQEQTLKVARDFAGLSPGRAEMLRRALNHKRSAEQIEQYRQEFVDGATSRDIPLELAQRVWAQVTAFGGYSFPKSHASAFATVVYQAAWLRRYHPLAFFVGLLRNQPMGFYPPHTIVSEARRFGVQILPVDVNFSDLYASAEHGALRLGLALVKDLGDQTAQAILDARRTGPFRSLTDFCQRVHLGRQATESLIFAGAFDGWRLSRRRLLWDLKAALETDGRPKLELESNGTKPSFRPLTTAERVLSEFTHTGVSARGHLTELVSQQMEQLGVTPSNKLFELPNDSKVLVGGIIAAAQRPPTANGVGFLALEDQTGMMNIVLMPDVYDANRSTFRHLLVVIDGILQKRDGAISILAKQVVPLEVCSST